MSYFFRLQQPGLTLEQMQSHKSFHGFEWVGDEDGEEVEVYLDGVATSDRCNETGFGGSCETEVVVMTGQRVAEIYDGVVVYPTSIVARYSYQQWAEMVKSGKSEMYD